MKICLVSAEYPPMQGGVGDCTRELARAMLASGHDVLVVTSRKAGVDAAPLASVAREPRVLALVDRWNWSCWSAVLNMLHSERPDILHIQYQTAAYGMHPAINLLPWRVRRMAQRPAVVTTFHDLRVPYLFPKAGLLRRWVTEALVLWSDGVIATNDEDLKMLNRVNWRRLAPRPARHLVPIGSNINPAPPQDYDRASWRERLQVVENDLLLCYFGFLNESKGGETLIRTLADLKKRNVQTKLLMIGGEVGASDPTNAAYARRIHELASELGVADQVVWTGYAPAEQVTASLLAADVCVLPYRDGVSLRRGSLMAALTHGLPIVSTRPRSPVPELVDGENILLVASEDAVGTADAVEKLSQSPELGRRLGLGSRELAQRFGWSGIAASTIGIYTTLLPSRENLLATS